MAPIFVADLIAITILVFAVFYPRHRRRDLVAAYLGVNVGVLAVSSILASVEVGASRKIGSSALARMMRAKSTPSSGG